MAVREADRTSGSGEAAALTAAQRRLRFGSNVALQVVMAALLLVILNGLGSMVRARQDLSRFGGYGLSDRTKHILDELAEPVRLTAVYTSTDPEKHRDEYLPRVEDLFEEMRLYRPDRVQVSVVRDLSDKRELERRFQEQFSSEAVAHRDFQNFAEQTLQEIRQALRDQLLLLTQIQQGDTWLGRFPQFTSILISLQQSVKDIEKTQEKVQELTSNVALPQYSEANNEIGALVTSLKSTLEDAQRWLEDAADLVEVMGEDRAGFFARTHERLPEMERLRADLVASIGRPTDPLPEDMAGALQAAARSAGVLADWLAGEVSRLNEVVGDLPALGDHPLWLFEAKVAIFVSRVSLPEVLSSVRKQLVDLRAQITTVLRQGPSEALLRRAVDHVREFVASVDATLEAVRENLVRLEEDFRRVPEAERQLLASVQGEDSVYGQLLERLKDLEKRKDDLPELKFGELADRLLEDNIVVVEYGKDFRVLSFDEVWVLEEDPFGLGTEHRRRTFAGDTAVASALLSMSQEKPFATVIITGFEPDIPQQFATFMRPPTGPIPMLSLNELQERLEKANFKVKQWNMAKEDAPPAPEEGTEAVYIVLPPPDVSHLGFAAAGQMPTWGPTYTQRLDEAVRESAGAVFACTYMIPERRGGFLGGTLTQPPYLLGDYLRRNWGIEVFSQYRVVYGESDPQHPGRYGVNLTKWNWLPLNNFTDHPIGRPFRGRYLPMNNVCKVDRAAEIPEGVTVEEVLTVPNDDNYWGVQNVLRIVQILTDASSGGWVTKDFDGRGPWEDIPAPFPVMLAAENGEGKRAVVTGTASSWTDMFLRQPIFRADPRADRIVFDPPPVANAELAINCLLWVLKREDLIGSGPPLTPLIQPISEPARRVLTTLVVAWAGLALVVGGAVMMVRRR